MEQQTEKGYTAAAAMFLLILVLLPVFWISRSQRIYIERQQAVIGEIETAHPDWTKEYLQILYEVRQDEETMEAGREALEKYAYTRSGLAILSDRILPAWTLPALGAIELLLLFLFLCLMARWRGKYREECRRLQEQCRRKQQEADLLSYGQAKAKRVKAFVENIAHQIKTPVSRCMTSLEILDGQQETDGKRERIRECLSHLGEIQALITKLLEIGRMETGSVVFHYDLFMLKDLLEEAVSSVKNRKKAQLRIIPSGSETVWSGDYRWMKEAIGNLLQNAIEHDSTEAPVEISCEQEKEYYVLRIRDHGPGIEKSDMEFLFDRFYVPAAQKAGHTGIGLNLAKLIIDGHHGTIHVQNHPEGGACFTICLPRYPAMKA